MMTASREPVDIIQTLAPNWHQVGISLDFDGNGYLVSQIGAKGSDPVLCCERVFMNWLDGRGKKQPATWRVLIEVLEELEYNALVEKIRHALGKYRKISYIAFGFHGGQLPTHACKTKP